MVTGLPSSGIEYEVRSVRRETSVARSASSPLPPDVCKVEDSVGAGKGGLRVSTPIAMIERVLASKGIKRIYL